MAFNIVLFSPEIPQNTGNIARTCAATGAVLHLIEPLGFSLDDRYMKRAGLDYWWLMEKHVYAGFDDFLAKNPGARLHFTSAKAPRSFSEAEFRDGDFIVFGCESKGLPEVLLKKEWERCIRVPMRAEARSLNLSNTVAVVIYEALRQSGYPGLCEEGRLSGREEETPAWIDYL